MKEAALYTESRPGYLYARVNGDKMTVELARQVIHDALEAARVSGYRRILYEGIRSERRLSVEDFYALARLLGEGSPGLRAALVVPRELHTRETNFFVTATKHHGATLQYFTDLFDAERWLLSV